MKKVKLELHDLLVEGDDFVEDKETLCQKVCDLHRVAKAKDRELDDLYKGFKCLLAKSGHVTVEIARLEGGVGSIQKNLCGLKEVG